MLQVKFIEENRDQVLQGLQKRNFAEAEKFIQEVLDLDQSRRATQHEMDQVKAKANEVARSIGQLKKTGKHDEAEKAMLENSDLKEQSKSLGQKLSEIESNLQKLLYQIPNVPHESVPAGNSDADNMEEFQKGVIPNLGSKAQAHWELIKTYDIIDFDLGNKVSGAGFPFYKGKGARLQRALINFFLDEAIAAGYQEVQPPLLINTASGIGTGQLPDKEGQMYHAQSDDLYLIPTAEVPITNIYRDVIVKEDDFPIKHVGYTPCFRREAGSWGADVRGLNRLHQFDKVEIVQIQKPEKSYDTLKEMCEYVQGLLEKLALPYRVLRLCGGDLGFTSALTFDMEVYSAGQGRWLEVSSVSNFETYQANRLNLRFKREKKKILAHTLNGSALALPRIVASILENNQSEKGIKIPDVLIPYTGFDWIN